VLEDLGRRHAARPRGRMRAGGGGRPELGELAHTTAVRAGRCGRPGPP
jgi:hypothetical protein